MVILEEEGEMKSEDDIDEINSSFLVFECWTNDVLYLLFKNGFEVSKFFFAPKALFEQGEKADAGSRKKSVRLDIDIYIYITFVWLFEMVFG